MSPENKKKVQDKVAETGKLLEGRLPALPELNNRNSYAHLWKCIKDRFGKSYKDCSDDDLNDIMEMIEHEKLAYTT
jgi:hypothetical protein